MEHDRKPYHMFTPMRVILLSASSAGKDNFMPASWCFPLSFAPRLFGVAVSPKRHTHKMIMESREFVINIPGEDMLGSIEKYGRLSGRNCDKFEESGLTKERSEKVGAVSIKECLASMECRVIDVVKTGDHDIFVGEVVNIRERNKGKGVYQKENDLVPL